MCNEVPNTKCSGSAYATGTPLQALLPNLRTLISGRKWLAAGEISLDCFRSILTVGQHRRSALHLGRRIQCDFCRADFTSVSGLANHLERGSCPKAPEFNCATLLLAIREPDTNGAIAVKHIGWSQERYHATQLAYNGSGWQCYICPVAFDTVALLNAHLSSSIHKQEIYLCTNPKCDRQFPSLSGLLGHLEAESCSFMRFAQVPEKGQGFQFVAFAEI
jgi:hypothetical protein